MSLPAGRIRTADTKVPFKLGSMDAAGVMTEHRYSNVWEAGSTTGSDRLIVAPSSGHVALIQELINELPEPFGILYVLVLTRRDKHMVGRYQSPEPSSRPETLAFLRDHEEYFERDGRHHVWVSSISTPGMIVYDHHNVIYTYGPLDAFERILHRRGLEPGEVRIPVPHSHSYNAEYDATEDQILRDRQWRWSPLHEQDDQ